MLGLLETEVMQVLWAADRPTSVRTALEALNSGRRDKPLAYTTVMTVMSRLAEKGILARSPEGRGYVYEPLAPDEAGIAVRDVLQKHGDAAVAHFAAEAAGDPALLERLRGLLDAQE